MTIAQISIAMAPYLFGFLVATGIIVIVGIFISEMRKLDEWGEDR